MSALSPSTKVWLPAHVVTIQPHGMYACVFGVMIATWPSRVNGRLADQPTRGRQRSTGSMSATRSLVTATAGGADPCLSPPGCGHCECRWQEKSIDPRTLERAAWYAHATLKQGNEVPLNSAGPTGPLNALARDARGWRKPHLLNPILARAQRLGGGVALLR